MLLVDQTRLFHPINTISTPTSTSTSTVALNITSKLATITDRSNHSNHNYTLKRDKYRRARIKRNITLFNATFQNMAQPKSSNWAHFIRFVIFVIIMIINSQVIYCSNQHRSDHNGTIEKQSTLPHKSASKILSATETNDTTSNSNSKSNYNQRNNNFSYYDFPTAKISMKNLIGENWLNLSSFLFNEMEKISSFEFDSARELFETTQGKLKTWSSQIRPLSHQFIDNLFQVFLEEVVNYDINYNNNNNNSVTEKHRIKRGAEYEQLHNVVNAPIETVTSLNKQRRKNRELAREDVDRNHQIEPQIIKSVYPRHHQTHMELMAQNGSTSDILQQDNKPHYNSDFLHNKSSLITTTTTSTNKPFYKVRLGAMNGRSTRKRKPPESSDYAMDQMSNEQPQADLHYIGAPISGTTPYPNQYYTTPKLSTNTLESPLSADSSADMRNGGQIESLSNLINNDNLQELSDENPTSEPVGSSENDEDKTNAANELYYIPRLDDENSVSASRGTVGRDRDAFKSSKRRAANLVAASGDNQIDNPVTPSPQLQTQVPPPVQSIPSDTTKDNNLSVVEIKSQKIRQLATGQQNHQNQATGDSVVPQVGDDLVVDHSEKSKNLDPLTEFLNNPNPQVLQQIIHHLENDLNAKKSKRPNRISFAPSNEQQQHSPKTPASLSSSFYHQQPSISQPQNSLYSQTNLDQANDSRSTSATNSIRSNAPYAAVSQQAEPTNGQEYIQQPSAPPRYQVESTSEPLPAPTASAIVSSDNSGASYIRYAQPTSMYSASVNNVIHQPVASRIRIPAEVSSHIEENFYNTNTNNNNNNNRRFEYQRIYRHPQVSAKITQASSRHPSFISPISQYWHSPSKLLNPNYYHASRNEISQDSQADQATYISPLPLGSQTQKHMTNLLRPLVGGSNGSSHQSSSSNLLRRTLPLILTNGYNHQYSSAGTSPAATILLPAYTALPFSGTTSKYTRNLHDSTQRHTTNSQHRIGRVANSQTNFDDSNTQSTQSAATSSEPMWSDTQNQEDEYQQAPQTIQITAVPNGLGVNNGLAGFNGLNGLNGLNGWNGWGGGPWNGRQVLLVNRQPTVGSEWTRWVLPVLAILALPVVLGSMLVPVFLKSVLFLIQILQMLGFLMPPSQLAGHLASSSHNPGAG